VSAQVCANDVSQNTLCLPQAAQRVISLAPHITELLYGVGAEQQIVGVMAGSDYPEQAKDLPTVGNYQSISIETIVSLKPDLVVAWPSGNPITLADQLKRFGIPMFLSDPESVADIAHDVRAIGTLTGHFNQAESQAQNMLEQKALLEKTYAKRAPVKTLLMISDLPMMGLSNKHAVAEAFASCGAVNVLAELPTKAPMISREALLLLQPQLIITTHQVSDQNLWLIQRGFVAPPRPEVVSINADLILRQTPRMLDGMQQFCELVEQLR